MKFIYALFALFFSVTGHTKSVALTYDVNFDSYLLQYQLMPNRTIGISYRSSSFAEDNYDNKITRYGITVSNNDFKDGLSFNLFLARTTIVGFKCDSCATENEVIYTWGPTFQFNYVWDWGLIISYGAGIYYQNKTYDYREPSFIGPRLYLPLSVGLTF